MREITIEYIRYKGNNTSRVQASTSGEKGEKVRFLSRFGLSDTSRVTLFRLER